MRTSSTASRVSAPSRSRPRTRISPPACTSSAPAACSVSAAASRTASVRPVGRARRAAASRARSSIRSVKPTRTMRPRPAVMGRSVVPSSRDPSTSALRVVPRGRRSRGRKSSAGDVSPMVAAPSLTSTQRASGRRAARAARSVSAPCRSVPPSSPRSRTSASTRAAACAGVKVPSGCTSWSKATSSTSRPGRAASTARRAASRWSIPSAAEAEVSRKKTQRPPSAAGGAGRDVRPHAGQVVGPGLQQVLAGRVGARAPAELQVLRGREALVLPRQHAAVLRAAPLRRRAAHELLVRQGLHVGRQPHHPDARQPAQGQAVDAHAALHGQQPRVAQHDAHRRVGLDGKDARAEAVALVLLQQGGVAHLVQDLGVDAVGAQPLHHLAFHEPAVHLLGEAAHGGAFRQHGAEAAFHPPPMRVAEDDLHLREREHPLHRRAHVQLLDDELLPVRVGERDGRGRLCAAAARPAAPQAGPAGGGGSARSIVAWPSVRRVDARVPPAEERRRIARCTGENDGPGRFLPASPQVAAGWRLSAMPLRPRRCRQAAVNPGSIVGRTGRKLRSGGTAASAPGANGFAAGNSQSPPSRTVTAGTPYGERSRRPTTTTWRPRRAALHNGFREAGPARRPRAVRAGSGRRRGTGVTGKEVAWPVSRGRTRTGCTQRREDAERGRRSSLSASPRSPREVTVFRFGIRTRAGAPRGTGR